MCNPRRDYPGKILYLSQNSVFSVLSRTEINSVINSMGVTKKTGVFVKEPLLVFVFDISSFAPPLRVSLAFCTICLILGSAATVLDL